MKELSIEQKAKRYDEIIEKTNKMHSENCEVCQICIEELIPELVESEDERIRKWLIEIVEEVRKANPTNESHNGNCSDAIAWLEKQGEKDEEILVLKDQIESLHAAIKAIRETHRIELEKQGEQKPADKVEPIFNVGDKIQFLKGCGTIMIIEKIKNGEYIFANNMGHTTIEDGNKWYLVEQKPAENEELTEFDKAVGVSIGTWNPKTPEQIQSVKAVSKKLLKLAKKQINDEQKPVCSEDRSKELSLSLQIQAYLNTASDELYARGKSLYSEKRLEDIHKCMLMWQKLHSAYFYQKPAWGEEDEVMFRKAIITIDNVRMNTDSSEYYQGICSWLISLKDRVGYKSDCTTKQEWKQENTHDLTDFENVMMHIGDSFFGENAGLDPNDTNTIKEQANILLGLVPKQEWSEEDERNLQGIIDEIEANKNQAPGYDLATYDRFISWLKSLRPQNRWKPSDEQMKALDEAVHGKIPESNALWYLYNDLEKLRKE